MTSTSTIAVPIHHQSPVPLYAALVGTFFLRMGGGIMGILIGLYLAAKDTEMNGPGGNLSYVIPATLVGIITASFFITELSGSFIAGNLIDRNGPKRYMIFGPLFGAVAVFITALLHLRGSSPPSQFILFMALLFATRLLEGAAGATTNPAALSYIAAYTSGDAKLRSRISGYFEIATLIGAALGFVFGGQLWKWFIDNHHGGQNAFLVDAAIYGLSALIFLVGVRNIESKGKVKPTEAPDLKQYVSLISSPRLRELVPAWLAISALLGVLFNHATFQLSNGSSRAGSEFAGGITLPYPGQTLSHAFNGGQIGLVFGLYAAAFGVGIVLWTLVIPRMRKSTIMMISAFGVLVSSLLIAAINHTALDGSNPLLYVLIPLMLIAVMVESGFTPAALVYLSDISEAHAENRGMVMGLYSFLLGFGQLLGSVIAGPFADRASIDGLLLFMSILGIISAISVTLLRKDELAHPADLKPKNVAASGVSEAAAAD